MKIIYLLENKYGAVVVAKCEVLEEKERTYKLRHIEDVLGQIGYISRVTNKNRYRWFDTVEGALSTAANLRDEEAEVLQCKADKYRAESAQIRLALAVSKIAEAQPA